MSRIEELRARLEKQHVFTFDDIEDLFEVAVNLRRAIAPVVNIYLAYEADPEFPYLSFRDWCLIAIEAESMGECVSNLSDVYSAMVEPGKERA